MKNMHLVLLFSCVLFAGPTPDAQTKQTQNQLPPYDDADGYQVLSAIIDGRTVQSKSESVLIFRNTLSERDLREIKNQCSDQIPAEFRAAEKDLGDRAKTRFRLQTKFSIQKEYRLVAAPVEVNDPSTIKNLAGVFSLSAVGFDEAKAHAVVLIEYLVRPKGSFAVGGDTTLYLLRKTDKGWQEAREVPKCGQIY